MTTPQADKERDGAVVFAAWFCAAYPTDYVIHDPAWHAQRIYRAAMAALMGDEYGLYAQWLAVGRAPAQPQG